MDFEALPTVVAIVGSRDWPKSKKHWIDKAVASLKPGTIVVSGGARGVDTWAEEATDKRKDLHFKPFRVEAFEWTVLGKSVGFVRNEVLVSWVRRYKGIVLIFALQKDIDAKEGGSYNVKTLCEGFGIPYKLYTV